MVHKFLCETKNQISKILNSEIGFICINMEKRLFIYLLDLSLKICT